MLKQPAASHIVYTDGSVFDGGAHTGTGWVIIDGKGTPRTGSRRIGETMRGTTTLAEIYAVSDALNEIPAGSAITLHCDDRDLRKVIKNDKIAARMQRHHFRPALQNAYIALFHAVARHESVTPAKARLADGGFARQAHDCAREGAYGHPVCHLRP